MAKLSRDFGGDTLHPRETLFGGGMLGAVGAEVVIAADGCGSVCLDMRGTYSLTAEVSGSVDGVNWTLIPVRLIAGASPVYVASVAGSVQGVWSGSLYGFRLVRVRCTALVSGAASVTISASLAAPDVSLSAMVTPNLGTIIGAVGAATTLTLAAPGLGLRHYLTYLSINRFAAAVLTASATPVAVATTNLPGALAFTFEADGAPLGSMVRWREDFAYPLVANAPNAATTIACPATPGVIWRVTAGFYLGGWLRIHDGGGATRARVNFEAGSAEQWGDIPAPLRQGMLRLVAHFHGHRDRAGDAGPPPAVAALWRSFRRLRLAGRQSA